MAMTPTIEQIDALRDLFFKKLEKDSPPDGNFHPKDVERVKTCNKWLELFLLQMDLDMKQALNMLWETCIWRKTFGTNEINENTIKMDYMNAGALFVHNKDIEGKYMIILRTKLHQKGSTDLNESIRLLVYWIERYHQETNYDKMTLFFDMAGAGLSNMDIEFTRKIIDTFKFYYPHSLNYIIIFEMPWILNAAFKIIKGLLPPKAVAIMKFVNSKGLKEFVSEDQALKSWGGKDNYEFKFVSGNIKTNNNNNNNNNITNNNVTQNEIKKVHFSNTATQMSELPSSTTLASGTEGEMLLIKPEDVIIFVKKENDEHLGSVEITNISSNNVTYKIKTTSPEKFRVRPSSGFLAPNGSSTINVVLQQGQVLSAMSKDKFLVMCMAFPSDIQMNTNNIQNAINELWKNTQPNSALIEQHRLRCTLPINSLSATGDGFKNGRITSSTYDDKQMYDGVSSAIGHLIARTDRLEYQIKFSQKLQWIAIFLFIFTSMAMFYILKRELNNEMSVDNLQTNPTLQQQATSGEL